MKKRQLYMIELDQEKQQFNLTQKNEFIKNFQTAILLSLLENKQLTKWQFDCCMDELSEKDRKSK